MSIRNSLTLTLLALALSACGSGNDQNQVNAYGQNTGPGPGPQPVVMCPQQTLRMWDHLVARRCERVQSDDQARWCAYGAAEFRDRNFQVLQGAGCSVAVRDARWCPGEQWQQQKFVQLNVGIVQSILDKYGWAASSQPSWPGNNGPGGPPRF